MIRLVVRPTVHHRSACERPGDAEPPVRATRLQQHRREHDRDDRVEGGEHGDDAEESPRRREREEHVRPHVAQADDRCASTGRNPRLGRSAALTARAAAKASRSQSRAPRRRDRVGDALLRGPVGEDEVEAEAERAATSASPIPAARARRRCAGSREATATPARARTIPTTCRSGLTRRDPDRERDRRRSRRDRRDGDPHRPDRHALVERADPETAARAGGGGQQRRCRAREAVAGGDDPRGRGGETDDLRDHEHGEHVAAAT